MDLSNLGRDLLYSREKLQRCCQSIPIIAIVAIAVVFDLARGLTHAQMATLICSIDNSVVHLNKKYAELVRLVENLATH